MVEYLMEKDSIDGLSDIEFIEYNTIRALPYYQDAPIILHTVL